MTTLVLDAGALIGYDRNDRFTVSEIRYAYGKKDRVRTTGAVIAQVWRDQRGRQANLARLLHLVKVVPVDDELGREAGVLLGRAGAGDAIDATVVAIAERGDRILTSDPDDIQRLVTASGRVVRVVCC